MLVISKCNDMKCDLIFSFKVSGKVTYIDVGFFYDITFTLVLGYIVDGSMYLASSEN